jgi:hypothetical protein
MIACEAEREGERGREGERERERDREANNLDALGCKWTRA